MFQQAYYKLLPLVSASFSWYARFLQQKTEPAKQYRLKVSEKTEAAKKAGRRVSVSGMLKFLGVSRSGYL